MQRYVLICTSTASYISSEIYFLFQNLANQNNTTTEHKYIEELLRITMKVSALCGSGYINVRIKAESLSDALYAKLFSYAVENDQTSNLNNALLVNLGLIKVRKIKNYCLCIACKRCMKANKMTNNYLFLRVRTKPVEKLIGI